MSDGHYHPMHSMHSGGHPSSQDHSDVDMSLYELPDLPWAANLQRHRQQAQLQHGPGDLRRQQQQQQQTVSADDAMALYEPNSMHPHAQHQPSMHTAHPAHYAASDAQTAALTALNMAGTIDPLSLQRFVGAQQAPTGANQHRPSNHARSAPIVQTQGPKPAQAQAQPEKSRLSERDTQRVNETLALLIPSAETLAAYSNLPDYLLHQPPLGSMVAQPEESVEGGEAVGSEAGPSSGKRTSTRKRGRPARTMPPSPPPTASLAEETPTEDETPQWIPAAYIRDRVAMLKDSWMNRATATHNLFIRVLLPQDAPPDQDEESLPATRLYPIHEMVLVSQLAYWQLLCHFKPARIATWKTMIDLHVPQPDFIDPLMHWLHHHDEQVLYDMLDEILDGNAGWSGLVWFARNVRSLGVCDNRIRAVVEALVHERLRGTANTS